MLERKLRKDRTEVTHRQPGTHPLPREDGRRAVTAGLPGERAHSSRYLAAGDYWFDDDTAGGQNGPDSRLLT
ncbi:hypothetical protein ACFCZ1_02695 [Streptomyces sp. NPDC056224]|uniref:hypothetical protein n=1 Tax=Streptomyces sp. NPDC056224 TaxID=3345750 RepID=UPI0035D73C25